jgi:hypothetical protein
MTYPNITHHGGATGVTGSCHRLQLAADRALLVDCGLFQGKDAEPSTTPVGAGLLANGPQARVRWVRHPTPIRVQARSHRGATGH